jgi:dTDP-4-dehydrorhamnose reductase
MVATIMPALQLWGGLECTVVRLGDRFRDQCVATGHRDRIHDLDRIAELGIKTLRYPILWETVAPDSPDEAEWSWHDERLAHLRDLGIRVIATLCHHGSGPVYTNLLDPAFPDLLAKHAQRVAQRYPWIELYTPVNEPLTTARFSALYGHWYPHLTDYGAFLRAVVNQCRATLLAMRAIRAVRGDAQLVQTEDLGKTFATPRLAYQAEHDNERRWLSFDLLSGRVTREHPLWSLLTGWGNVAEHDLALLGEGEAAPDVVGINHYLTSDRYLDHRLAWFPEQHHGGNGRDRYADVEAVRVDLPDEEIGPAARLQEAWARYRRPVAVTEVHHGCTRDEQLRWLMQVWNAALKVRAEGADIRAVTVWALLGTVDWNSLLTRSDGIYEPGAFDARGPKPRPTALATAATSLARTGTFDHPVLDDAGWWRRPTRFYRPPLAATREGRLAPARRRLLITGATGTLGQAFSRICEHRGLAHVLTSRRDLEAADRASVEAALRRYRPWAVINTAGYVKVAEAGREPDLCIRENARGAETLALACAAHGIPLITFSSDLVFDGQLARPHVESDHPNPRCVYGESKALAERAVLASCTDALAVRTSAFFGPWDRHNFVFAVLQSLSAGKPFDASLDIVSPTYVPDLVHVVLDLLIDGERGIWHLTNTGALSWAELAREVAARAGLDASRVRERVSTQAVRNTALSSERGLLMPPVESALDRYLRDCEIPWRESAGFALAAE